MILLYKVYKLQIHMSFRKIKNFILQNKKSLLFLVFLIWSIFPDFAFAEWEEDVLITILSYFIAWIGTLLALMTSFVSWFLTPEWTSGSAIWFWEKLKDLWLMMSNVVYTIFAIILIFIAFMNIIWKWENTWELKQALPKFIVWVLIVPFSWFIVSACIWLSSILTVSVLTIPSSTFWWTYEKLNNIPFCGEFVYNLAWSKWTNWSDEPPIKCIPPTDSKWKPITYKAFIDNSDHIFGIMSIYTYWIMKIDWNWQIFTDDIKTIKQLTALGAKVIFDILFIIVFFLLMVALLMALFVRGIYIWIFMVLSPIFWLLYFFWDKTHESLQKFTFWKFLELVMMPVYVAAALSFGLLFILVAWPAMGTAEEWSNWIIIEESTGDWSSSITFLGTKHTFVWAFSSAWDDAKDLIKWVHWQLGTLILQVFWLVVMWISVMAALKSSELTKEVIQPIVQFGESVWQLAAKAPTYAPIIPSPGWWTMSATALWTMWSSLKTNIDSKFSTRWNDIASELFKTDEITKAIQNQTAKLNKSELNKTYYKDEEVKKAIARMWKEDWNDSHKRWKTIDLLETIWIDKKKLEPIKSYTDAVDKLPWILNTEIKTWTTPSEYKDLIENKTTNVSASSLNTFNLNLSSWMSKSDLITSNNWKLEPVENWIEGIIDNMEGISNINESDLRSEVKSELSSLSMSEGELNLVIEAILKNSKISWNIKK